MFEGENDCRYDNRTKAVEKHRVAKENGNLIIPSQMKNFTLMAKHRSEVMPYYNPVSLLQEGWLMRMTTTTTTKKMCRK